MRRTTLEGRTLFQERTLWGEPESGVRRRVRIPYPYLISGNNPYPFPYPYQTFQLVTYPYPSTYLFLKSTRTPYQIPYLFWKITRTRSRLRTHFFDFSYVPVPVPISVHIPYTSRTRDFWSRRDRGKSLKINHLIKKNSCGANTWRENCITRYIKSSLQYVYTRVGVVYNGVGCWV